jgi:diguanylate cyclase (GGDEF)-like protein/PAS domain S-box-containing protein
VSGSEPKRDEFPNGAPPRANEPARANGQPGEEDRWLRSVVENSSEIVTIVDPDGTLRYASPAFGRVLGHDPEEAVGVMNVLDYVHPDDLPHVLEDTEKALSEGGVVTNEAKYRFRHADGSWRWVESVGTYLLDDPHVGGVVVTSRDVTERKEAEEALRESEQRFRKSFNDAAIGMALVATDGRFLQANRSLREIVGYTEEELLSKTFQDLTHPDDLQKDLDNLRRMLAGEIRTYQMEKRYLHKEGHIVWALVSVSLVHAEGGEPLYFVSQIQDVTDRKSMEARLQLQALHDPLTGLANRHLFGDRLRHALERTRRRRGRKVAVLFMDLDGFTVVNDSLGHEVGDLLLTVVAQRLRRCLRLEDTLARFGGDEFVVLLEEVEHPGGAVLVAERITEELRRPFALEGRELFAPASIGIALGDARTKTPEDLLRDADTAMYRAKDENAPHRVFDPAMYEQAKGRLELENELRRGIEREEFVVYYQPIVNLQSDGLWGLEALVRWEHPERGLLDPSEFMLVVEESGLMVPIGEGVLEEACRQAKRWQEDPRIPPLVVSVNLSAGQLRRPDFFRAIGDSLRKTRFDARRLSLNITETAYIRVLEGKTAALNRLKELGITDLCGDC